MTTSTFPHHALAPRERPLGRVRRVRLWTVLIAAAILLAAVWVLSVGVTLNANSAIMMHRRHPPLYGHAPSGPVPIPPR